MNAHIERAQTLGEEIANSVSHGLTFLMAVAALPVLVHAATQRGGAAGVVAACLFTGSMIVLYGVSTLYHALPRGRAKVFFKRLDHAAIFLFIAGSYTPFLFGVLSGAWGWSLFGVIWAAAILGMVVLNEPVTAARIFFVCLLLVAVVGLKATSGH